MEIKSLILKTFPQCLSQPKGLLRFLIYLAWWGLESLTFLERFGKLTIWSN
jgi:hypothetical protein